nr:DUF6466 family protein [Bifidobacterium simiarum]
MNWRALSVNNAAVASLNASIDEYAKASPDLDKLKNAQQATDAQFRDAQSPSWVLMPSVRSTIGANAAESKRLTDRINADANGSKTGGSSGELKSGKAGSANDSKSDAQDDKKLDQLLNQNDAGSKVDPSTVPSASPSSSPSSSTGSDNKTVKPW